MVKRFNKRRHRAAWRFQTGYSFAELKKAGEFLPPLKAGTAGSLFQTEHESATVSYTTSETLNLSRFTFSRATSFGGLAVMPIAQLCLILSFPFVTHV